MKQCIHFPHVYSWRVQGQRYCNLLCHCTVWSMFLVDLHDVSEGLYFHSLNTGGNDSLCRYYAYVGHARCSLYVRRLASSEAASFRIVVYLQRICLRQ